MSNRWQGTFTYTLSKFGDADPVPHQYFLGDDGIVKRRAVGFPLARDMGDEYTGASTDQTHRAVFNAIVDVGRGFQASGIYFYGSGERRSTTAGVDRRDKDRGPERLLADGTILERNGFIGSPIHRVDLRFQQRVQLGGNRTIALIGEVFNVLNHENFGSYVTNVSSPKYEQATYNRNIVYQSRSAQIGFRIGF